MRYRSSQDARTIYQKHRQRLKKNKINFLFALICQILLMVLFVSVPLILLWYWQLLPPRIAFVPLLLDATTQIPAYLSNWFGQFASWQLLTLGGLLFIMIVLFVHLWTLAGYGYWLKLMTSKKRTPVEAMATLKKRPFRHFLVGLSKNAVATVLFSVWLAITAIVGIYAYAWVLSILNTGMNAIMRIAFLSGAGILFFGSTLLIAWPFLWLYFGLKWVTLPLSDAPEMPVHHAYGISWRLMKDNRWLLIKLKLRSYLPVLMTTLVLGLILRVIDTTKVPYVTVVFGSVGLLMGLWLWLSWGHSQLVEVLLYREQTEQYARRLNDTYPAFNAQPKPGMAQRYHTEKHPTFTPKAVRVSSPEEAETTAGGHVPSYQPRHRYQLTDAEKLTKAEQERIPDPGYRISSAEMKKPISAGDIFDGKGYNSEEH